MHEAPSGLMQVGNSGPHKELETAKGHVIARFRTLKGDHLWGTRLVAPLGNSKDFQ
jgi:hypothetical protein